MKAKLPIKYHRLSRKLGSDVKRNVAPGSEDQKDDDKGDKVGDLTVVAHVEKLNDALAVGKADAH